MKVSGWFAVAVANDAEPRTFKSGALSLGRFSVDYVCKNKNILKYSTNGANIWNSLPVNLRL